MRLHLIYTVVALTSLILSGCSRVDLDVALSDDNTSTLDGRLIGLWECTQKAPGENPGCFFVQKKPGTKNTLELVTVVLEKKLNVGVQRFDMFARSRKHTYLSIVSNPPDESIVLPRWLLARYQVSADGSITVHAFNYDAYRAAIRREILQGRLNGEIKGRRRRSDWDFALPGHEEQRVVFTDSAEALVKFLDENGDLCFDKTPIVFRKREIVGKLHLALPINETPPPSSPPPSAANAAQEPLRRREPPKDDFAIELPQSFEVAATLRRPGDYEAGRFEAFRSVALRMPWVYVLDRTGTLGIFRIEKEGQSSKELRPLKIVDDAGDGDDLKVFGDVLICTRAGSIEAYSLEKPGEPQPLGRFGPKAQCDSQSIVRLGQIAFLIGPKAIQTYDLSMPRKPKFLGTFETKHGGWIGCAAEKLLYVDRFESGRRGITVFDVSDPAHPIEVSFVPTSHAPYAVFATPNRRLLVSMDSEQSWHSVSTSHISINGNSALFDLTNLKRPLPIKEYAQSGGRTAALLNVNNDSYFACNGIIFAVKNDGLEPNSVFYPNGTTLDGQPYHGDAEGNYVALAADDEAVVLRLKNTK